MDPAAVTTTHPHLVTPLLFVSVHPATPCSSLSFTVSFHSATPRSFLILHTLLLPVSLHSATPYTVFAFPSNRHTPFISVAPHPTIPYPVSHDPSSYTLPHLTIAHPHLTTPHKIPPESNTITPHCSTQRHNTPHPDTSIERRPSLCHVPPQASEEQNNAFTRTLYVDNTLQHHSPLSLLHHHITIHTTARHSTTRHIFIITTYIRVATNDSTILN